MTRTLPQICIPYTTNACFTMDKKYQFQSDNTISHLQKNFNLWKNKSKINFIKDLMNVLISKMTKGAIDTTKVNDSTKS